MAPNLAFVAFVLTIISASGCASLEHSLLYHPVPITPDEYEAPPPPMEDVELRTADGTMIHARWSPHPDASGAVLYCPGNGGNLEYRAQPISDLRAALGESVLIFDYPGYGRSAGEPSENACYAAADAAYRWLVEKRRRRGGRTGQPSSASRAGPGADVCVDTRRRGRPWLLDCPFVGDQPL
jgi:hypothetical protein